ncbi:MAG: glycoside hydrolase family 48 protein, partial [Halanaerobiales bacterium]
VEAPDYVHLTTSEALSYYVWLEAMYGKYTGDWSGIDEAWDVIEEYMVPNTQVGLDTYDPSDPASYIPEYGDPSEYPGENMMDVSVGEDPIWDELSSTYGDDEIYGMHWLVDVDNWYEYGEGNEPTFINTFQRGEEESVWETVPHPSIEEFEYGGPNGFLDLFVDDESYSEQARYTNAPDADARAIQATYWANKWAEEEGENLTDLTEKAAKMGDYMRYGLFDKYFKSIDEDTDLDTGGSGYDGAHYLLAWYYSWGGGMDGYWAYMIGSSHAHFGYQNPMAAYALSNESDLIPESSSAEEDWEKSLDRTMEFYMWLQSDEGAIAGGATNSWRGRYEDYPSDSTFHGMVYEEHPVYKDPGSNEWTGMQAWSMQRVAELYLESGNEKAKYVLDNWVDWILSEIHLYDSEEEAPAAFEIPATLEWEGKPEPWESGSETWDNPDLHVEVADYGQDLGVTGSLANALVTYAKAVEEHEGTMPEEPVDVAQGLMDRVWEYCRDDIGVTVPEARGDYERFFDEVYIPDGWSGEMGNGDTIEPGVEFVDIRSKYKDMPEFQTVEEAVNNDEDPEFEYHRFWAQADVALALAALENYTDRVPDGSEETIKGDINDDGEIDSMDATIFENYLLGNISSFAAGSDAADMNDDGDLDSLDLTLLVQELLTN